MANYEKKFKKLKEKFDSAVDESFDSGFDEGSVSGYDEGHVDGFSEGVAAHKEMVRNRLTMLFDTYMSTNKFAKAKEAKEILEYLEWEYDPVKAEENYRIEMENF